MENFIVIFGASLIVVGFIVRIFPDWISPYSMMSKEEKENVDIKSIALVYQRCFFLIGALTIVIYYLFKYLGLDLLSEILFILPLFVILPIMLIITQKYDRNKRVEWLKKGLPIFLLLFFGAIFFLIVIGLVPTKVVISDSNIKFTGQYGVSLPLDQIESYSLLEKRPKIRRKVNGLGVGGVCKGYFVLDEIGRCRLFMESNMSPYLFIQMKNGDKILYNSKKRGVVKESFEELKLEMTTQLQR